MIKIIKAGTRKITTCDNCGCKFSYEDEDIKRKSLPQYTNTPSCIFGTEDVYVTCPQCSNDVILSQTR